MQSRQSLLVLDNEQVLTVTSLNMWDDDFQDNWSLRNVYDVMSRVHDVCLLGIVTCTYFNCNNLQLKLDSSDIKRIIDML